MQSIHEKDRSILRALAEKYMSFAQDAKNDRIVAMWFAQAQCKKETPTVRLLFSNFQEEVLWNRLQCEGESARQIESKLLSTLVGRELFDDDTPIPPYYPVSQHIHFDLFGVSAKRTDSEETTKGYHIEPLFSDLEEGIHLLKNGSFSTDKAQADRNQAYVEELFGDILPVKRVSNGLTGAMTNPLVHLMGMENYYLAMYDCPDTLHEIMDHATTLYERYYDFLEAEQLLLPTNGFSGVPQESFAFTKDLPSDHVTKTTDCWGFLESQETTAVAPETFGEFVFPYQDRLVKRYGLLSYGCCERVDAIFEPYLSKWQNLRKLSVSPFNNERQIGDYLRGTDIVYYSKPRAEYVTNRGPQDEDALRAYFKEVCTCASGCLFEIAQREVGTIFGDYERGRRYVEIAKQCVQEYWQP